MNYRVQRNMDEYIRNVDEIPLLREACALRNLWRNGSYSSVPMK